MKFWFWWSTGRTTPVVAHYEVVAWDAICRRTVDADLNVTQAVPFDAAIRQTVAVDVER